MTTKGRKRAKTTTTDGPPLLVTPAAAAKLLSLDRTSLYPMIMSGELPSIKVGRARRISLHAIEDWIQTRESGAATVKRRSGGQP